MSSWLGVFVVELQPKSAQKLQYDRQPIRMKYRFSEPLSLM